MSRGIPRKRQFHSGTKVDSQDFSPDDVIIVLMGPTGSGKSSFIEKATGIKGIAGHSLRSCTNDISVIKLPYSQTGNLCFVDTPGFDDTNRSDLDIFKLISEWLIKSYKKEVRLSGLLYFHRISDNRMAGTSLKNFHLFEKLCGNDFSKIVLTTTMWNEVDEWEGAKREQELKREFWRPMIERGSSIQRFHYSRDSAFEIIRPIFDDVHRRSARALLLQNEVTDRGLLLKETSAGQTLKLELGELIVQQQAVLGSIRRELAAPDCDSDQLQHLMDDYQRVSMQLQCASDDMRKMDSSMGDWFRKLAVRVDLKSLLNRRARNLKEKETLMEEHARQAVRMWLEGQKRNGGWRQ